MIPLPPPHRRGKNIEDLTGRTFGRLTVLGLVSIDEISQPRWLCQCACGNKTNSLSNGLKCGTAKSCGCFRRERTTKHGDTSSSKRIAPEYICLNNILQRCNNSESTSYPRYGAKGVSVCDEWNSLEKYPAFLAYMGRRPSDKHSIDRFPNCKGNYEPGNVRWATKAQQSENRGSTIFIEYNGETKCIADTARKYKIPVSTLLYRIKKGWPPNDAIIIPSRSRHSNRKRKAQMA